MVYGVDRVQAAQYQLDLILSFFPRTDAMLAATLGLDMAMIGVAFARAPGPGSISPAQALVVIAYLGLAAMSFWSLYKGSFPDTDGGVGSLIYFGNISKIQPQDYVQRYGALTEEDLSQSLLHQAWRNSCILDKKFAMLKEAYRWMLASLVPWAIALLIFSPAKSA